MSAVETIQPNTLQLSVEDSWLTICFNRPEARNALSGEMVEELLGVLDAVAADSTIRGITMRGNGAVFCAGGDLKGFRQGFQSGEADSGAIEAASRRAGELYERINTMPQVVLMLVEGAAMAGGLGIVCAGDIVAVTAGAKFALTEVTLGIPPAQIAPFVIARIGMPAGRRLMLTAARFDGTEAARIGLADHVVENAAGFDRIEQDLRRDVMRCAPHAVAVTKDIILQTRHLSGEAMRTHAARGFAKCMVSDEAREGIAAFVEKRQPVWGQDRQ